MTKTKTNDTALLMEMLTYKRWNGSRSERKFIRKFIDVVPGMLCDTAGNRYIVIGDDKPDVMWSCHTDTVHKGSGRQSVCLDKGVAKLSAGSDSNCLGADCAAGVYVCLKMIHSGVAGLYVFHRAEEVGGIGSACFAECNPGGVLDRIEWCIAFDRRGDNSVITHQGIGRCASDEAAISFADATGLDLRCDPTGSFTDSMTYAQEEVVRECLNISVGYDNEHRKVETLDTAWLFTLTDAMCHDFDKRVLVRKREHKEYGYSEDLWGAQRYGKEIEWVDAEWNDRAGTLYDADAAAIDNHMREELLDAISHDPAAVLRLFKEYGIEDAEVWDVLTAQQFNRQFS